MVYSLIGEERILTHGERGLVTGNDQSRDSVRANHVLACRGLSGRHVGRLGGLVSVGGTRVGVGCSGVLVVGAAVRGAEVGDAEVGGSGVAVGGTAVLVAGMGVSVAGGGSVGIGVGVGGTVLVTDGTGVNVGLRVFVGIGVGVGALARKLGTPHPKPISPRITSAKINLLCLIEHPLLFKAMAGVQAGAHYSRSNSRCKNTLVFG